MCLVPMSYRSLWMGIGKVIPPSVKFLNRIIVWICRRSLGNGIRKDNPIGLLRD